MFHDDGRGNQKQVTDQNLGEQNTVLYDLKLMSSMITKLHTYKLGSKNSQALLPD